MNLDKLGVVKKIEVNQILMWTMGLKAAETSHDESFPASIEFRVWRNSPKSANGYALKSHQAQIKLVLCTLTHIKPASLSALRALLRGYGPTRLQPLRLACINYIELACSLC